MDDAERKRAERAHVLARRAYVLSIVALVLGSFGSALALVDIISGWPG